MKTAAFFRANVGACIVNAEGRVLAFKRKGVAEHAWQMPQGGIEAGEDPLAAVWCEVREETGLLPHQLEIIAEYPEWLVYEVPVEYRNSKLGWGQAQKWFLFRASPTAVPTPDGKEFEDCAWMKPADLIPLVMGFRLATYERVFALLAASSH